MNMFKNLSVGMKLKTGFMAMTILILITGAAGYSGINKIEKILSDIFSVKLPAIDYLIEADRDLQQLLVAERSMIFSNVKSDQFKGLANDYETNMDQAWKRWTKFKNLPLTQEEKAVIPVFEAAWNDWKKTSLKVYEGRKSDTRQGRKEAIDLTLGAANKKFETMRDQLDKLTEINLALAEKENQAAGITHKNMITLLFIVIGISLAAGFFFSFIINRGISTPIANAMAMLKDIAQGEGDLTKRLDISSQDEIGQLCQWFNTFMDKLQGLITDIAGNSGQLNTSSNQVAQAADKMNKTAEDLTEMSTAMAAATEEMSSNMTGIAAAMEQSSTNIDMVAASSEEMNATINEIAQNAEKSRSVSQTAVSQTGTASEKMKSLGDAAQQIGKVTETITQISEQTNLLALNATIEAARAGEAGKGFAVVANEIKELAVQTSEATQRIEEQIGQVQKTAGETVSEIEKVSEIIHSINEIVTSIAGAVEEQSTATGEISQNIGEASKGAQEVSENVSQSTSVANEISQNISDVNASAGKVSGQCRNLTDNAQELSQLADTLNQVIGQFKV